jgi:hypothetical protein
LRPVKTHFGESGLIDAMYAVPDAQIEALYVTAPGPSARSRPASARDPLPHSEHLADPTVDPLVDMVAVPSTTAAQSTTAAAPPALPPPFALTHGTADFAGPVDLPATCASTPLQDAVTAAGGLFLPRCSGGGAVGNLLHRDLLFEGFLEKMPTMLKKGAWRKRFFKLFLHLSHDGTLAPFSLEYYKSKTDARPKVCACFPSPIYINTVCLFFVSGFYPFVRRRHNSRHRQRV